MNATDREPQAAQSPQGGSSLSHRLHPLWRFAKGVARGFYWTLLTTVFGLLHVLGLLVLTLAFHFNYSLSSATDRGELLMFSAALVASITVDQGFSNSPAFAPQVERLLFRYIPFCLLFLTGMYYAALNGANPLSIKSNALRISQLTVLAVLYVYATSVKSAEFLQAERSRLSRSH
jgi:hypothetical protein